MLQLQKYLFNFLFPVVGSRNPRPSSLCRRSPMCRDVTEERTSTSCISMVQHFCVEAILLVALLTCENFFRALRSRLGLGEEHSSSEDTLPSIWRSRGPERLPGTIPSMQYGSLKPADKQKKSGFSLTNQNSLLQVLVMTSVWENLNIVNHKPERKWTKQKDAPIFQTELA